MLGTGKSLTLKELVRSLRLENEDSEDSRVFVTASTGEYVSPLRPFLKQFLGIASVAIGGTTLHSWAGIGLGKGPVETLRWKVLGHHGARKRWKETAVLVIDESTLLPAVEACQRPNYPQYLW